MSTQDSSQGGCKKRKIIPEEMGDIDDPVRWTAHLEVTISSLRLDDCGMLDLEGEGTNIVDVAQCAMASLMLDGVLRRIRDRKHLEEMLDRLSATLVICADEEGALTRMGMEEMQGILSKFIHHDALHNRGMGLGYGLVWDQVYGAKAEMKEKVFATINVCDFPSIKEDKAFAQAAKRRAIEQEGDEKKKKKMEKEKWRKMRVDFSFE